MAQGNKNTRAKKGSNGRTWKMLLNEYGDNGKPSNRLDNFCEDVFMKYVESDCTYTGEVICKHFNINPKAFPDIQYYAITRDLVTDNMIIIAEEKSIQAQRCHHGLAGRKTSERISKALADRELFRQEKKEKAYHEEMLYFFKKFTFSGLSFREYAFREGKTYDESVELLAKCLVLGLLDEDLINAIRINCDSINDLTKKQKSNNKTFFEGVNLISEAFKNGFTLK